MTATPCGTLLAVIELGGYPNFLPLYRNLSFEPVIERSVRKALAALKRIAPAAVVAGFNF